MPRRAQRVLLTETPASLARRLPDLPRFVEARDLLLSGEGEVFGVNEQPELAFVILDEPSIFVIGRPDVSVVHAAIEQIDGTAYLVAPPEQASWLTNALRGWTLTKGILHVLPSTDRLPQISGDTGFVDPSTLDQVQVPDDLLDELKDGAAHSPIAASFVDDRPVSFCYAGAVTETLWDIAVDTLPEHQREGHAARAVTHMIHHMQTRGKQPVWDAAEDNPASWRLAQKLGFVAVDELALFERPDPSNVP